ncbi:GNAT family N-acetyltransferase [Clostridium frigidicarnis]|uniref:Acetyltransferase (GNAT) domain-containing protein n=1 Tax=Clostridium frigidicarnis TaxID=84698 RepID=A0A1I0YZK2_9CLOT|nr:GNAT family N-acetyltransferase [Clostridium frigidicarnis]SFB18477.1 Acetyltransferase (GNAT) domain-containing protein [Clostridium frigidicarnis]
MDIIYKEIRESYNKEELRLLYHDTAWINYGNDIDKTKRSIEKSLCTIGAFCNDKLVGIIRVIGDDERIIYIQELVVLRQYKRKGIGKTLIKLIRDKYKHITDIVLITDNTDNNPETNGFYKTLGFKEASEYGTICYMKCE